MGVSKFSAELTAAMDAVIAHRRDGDDWESRGGGNWRASSLGSCPRSQILQRIPVPTTKVFDPKTLRIFALGDLLHGWATDIFGEAHILVATEPRFHSDAWQLTGHVDGVLLPRSSDGIALLGLEVKTANATTMKSIVEYGPKPEHVLQVGAYMLMAAAAPDDEWHHGDPDVMASWHPTAIEDWVLAYLGKDYAGLVVVDAEPKWMEEAANVLTMLNTHWESRTLPVCTCTTAYGGTGPFYCDFPDRDQDRKLVAAMAHATSKAKKDMAPKVMCCGRSPETAEAITRLWWDKSKEEV